MTKVEYLLDARRLKTNVETRLIKTKPDTRPDFWVAYISYACSSCDAWTLPIEASLGDAREAFRMHRVLAHKNKTMGTPETRMVYIAQVAVPKRTKK